MMDLKTKKATRGLRPTEGGEKETKPSADGRWPLQTGGSCKQTTKGMSEAKELKRERNTSQLPKQLCCKTEKTGAVPRRGEAETRGSRIYLRGAHWPERGVGLRSTWGGGEPWRETERLLGGNAGAAGRARGVASSMGGPRAREDEEGPGVAGGRAEKGMAVVGLAESRRRSIASASAGGG